MTSTETANYGYSRETPAKTKENIMFHISNLGQFASKALENEADANGYVPELGDKFEEFDYSHLPESDRAYLAEQWDDELNKIDELIREANAQIKAWREASA